MVGGVVSTATSMSSRRCLDGRREDAGGFVFVEHLNVPEVIGANISCYHGVTRFGMRLPLVRVATSKRRKPVTNGRKAAKNGRRRGVDRRRNGAERSGPGSGATCRPARFSSSVQALGAGPI